MKGYWSIEDYLSGEEIVSFTTEDQNIKNIISTTSYSKNDHKISVPLWLAKALVARDLGTAYMPNYLASDYRRNLTSEPEILSLSQRSLYFYEISSYFSYLYSDNELMDIILKMYISRVKSLFKYLEINTREKQIDKLAIIEKHIYELTRTSTIEIQQWKERNHEKIIPDITIRAKPSKKLKLGEEKTSIILN